MKINATQLLFLIEHGLVDESLLQKYDKYREAQASGRKLQYPKLSEFLALHIEELRKDRWRAMFLFGLGVLFCVIGLLPGSIYVRSGLFGTGIILFALALYPIFDIQSSNRKLRAVLDDFNDLIERMPGDTKVLSLSRDALTRLADMRLSDYGKELNRSELTLGFYYQQTMNLRDNFIHTCQTFEKFDLPCNPRKYYNVPVVGIHPATEDSSPSAAQATS